VAHPAAPGAPRVVVAAENAGLAVELHNYGGIPAFPASTAVDVLDGFVAAGAVGSAVSCSFHLVAVHHAVLALEAAVHGTHPSRVQTNAVPLYSKKAQFGLCYG
jgi:hypothetical protein